MSDSWWNNLRGKFLAFEGPDGSGKSTQIARLEKFCKDKNLKMLTVREPGGTAIGERVREVLLDPTHGEMDVRCEMLLYMASRAQLMRSELSPRCEMEYLFSAIDLSQVRWRIKAPRVVCRPTKFAPWRMLPLVVAGQISMFYLMSIQQLPWPD